MVKILSQAGNSLADVYDVDGSIAGINQLETHELPIVHEMGNTVFSERLSGSIRRISTGAIAQNITFDIVLTDLPATPGRIFSLAVFNNVTSRVNDVTISIRNVRDEREVPIWNWFQANGVEVTGRLQDDGAAVGNVNLMLSDLNMNGTPSLLVGTDQPQPVDQIAFRGGTQGFGAGTVTITAVIYIAFSQVAGISSRGLPIPSW